jgi:hypothetical protein
MLKPLHPLVPPTRATPRPRRHPPLRGPGRLPHPHPSRGRPGRRVDPPQPRHHPRPGQPPRPVQLDLVFRTERGTPISPNHASRSFARLAAGVGLTAHPHLLGHALASAMAANKEPASVIAASCATPTVVPLPSGCASTSSPDRAPAGRGDRGQVRSGGAADPDWVDGVGWASGGGKPEGNPALKALLTGYPLAAFPQLNTSVAGTGFEPVKACRRFTGRTAGSPRVPRHPRLVQDYGHDVHGQPVASFGRHLASPPVPRCPGRPGVGRSESGANPGSGQGRDRP